MLLSFHYHARRDLSVFSGCRVIGDSGAFSAAKAGAVVSTAELAEWALRWRSVLTWVASLDLIGDVEASRRNWHDLVDGFGIDAVPTIHFGCDPAAMDYYVERGVDFIGLGGTVGQRVDDQLGWLAACFRHARGRWPQVRFHGWGVTSDKLYALPFYSVDSSAWVNSFRFGKLTLRDPATGARVATVVLDGSGRCYEPRIARVLALYGVTPSEIDKAGPHNRRLLVKLSALQASVWEQHVRRVHRREPISAPTWGVPAGEPAGPHQHLALGIDRPACEFLSDPAGYSVGSPTTRERVTA